MAKKLFLLIIATILSYVGFYFIIPDIAKLKKQNPKKTSFMEFREKEGRDKGRPLQIKTQWVPLSRISPYLIKAVIIAEDDKFWSHEGFDFEALEKALEKDIKTRKFKVGGSTISQQLAKNLYLTPSKNLIRKVKEAILTWRIEKTLTKKRIIELYLNVVEWGDGIFGIEAAARHYFGESAAALSPEEAARLAVILPNPRKLNPVGRSRYVDKRARVIQDIMLKRGIIIPAFEEVMTQEKEIGRGDSPEIFQEDKGEQAAPPSTSESSRKLGEDDGLDSKN